MQIVLELYELKNICMQMSELGAANYIKQTKPMQDLISQREAYRLFNESRVKRWVAKSVVSPVTRTGNSPHSKVLYSMADLMAVDKSEKMNKYINKL